MGQQKKAFRAPKRDGGQRGEGPKPEQGPPDADEWQEWWEEWQGVDADAPHGAADEPSRED